MKPTGALASQIEHYRLHAGRYPRQLRDLIERPTGETSWSGPYIKDTFQLKDAWGADLQYRFPSPRLNVAYDLWSMGPDRVSGTSDDISN